MDHTPCEPDFLLWWEKFLLIQAGLADLSDVFRAAFHWRLSMELQLRLGRFDD